MRRGEDPRVGRWLAHGVLIVLTVILVGYYLVGVWLLGLPDHGRW